MQLREALKQVSGRYQEETKKPFGNNKLAAFIRDRLPAVISDTTKGRGLKIEASSGKGQWTHVPWLALFEPSITESAQQGYYVVYLFSQDMTKLFLSLNQGVTSVSTDFGTGKRAERELQRRAMTMLNKLDLANSPTQNLSIQLNSDSKNPRLYEAGHIYGYSYDLKKLPSEEHLIYDLNLMLDIYRKLILLGGDESLSFEDTINLEKLQFTIEEQKQYVSHRRIERKSSTSETVKLLKGYSCEVCDFDFEEFYGEIGENYIEAHHLTPLSTLPLNAPIPMDPIDDFAVLCSNCHRMAHKKSPPYTIEELKEMIKKAKSEQS